MAKIGRKAYLRKSSLSSLLNPLFRSSSFLPANAPSVWSRLNRRSMTATNTLCCRYLIGLWQINLLLFALNSYGATEMDNPSKTEVVERDDPAPVTDYERDQELTAQALDGIHGAERLSGFGRFATKMQSIFQGPQASQPSKSAAQLRAVPIMMSAGVLLLIATGLLFLFSKPESAVPGHFRQRRGLSGADNQKRVVGSADGADNLTESQLVGSDMSAG